MNFNIKKCAAAMLATAAALCATAQNTQSGYFIDDYAYRFLSNPALAPSHGKFLAGIPGISNLNVNMRGNLALTDVIYNVNGKTTTFMNPGVSAAEAMSNLSDMNRLGFDIRENILSFGFGMLGGYSTINISARANVNTRLPKSIFSFLKEGVTNDTYEIDGLKARAIGYGEISLGHSRNITGEIRVGANVKVLLGVGSVKADLDRATLALNRDSWDITTNASIHTSLKGYTYETKYSEDTHREYVSGLDGSFKPVNGFGMAFDLGATYAPKALKDCEFSAALLDLGFIKWGNDLYATTNGDRSLQSSIYNFSADDNAPNSFSNEWDRVRNSLEELYQLDDAGSKCHRQPRCKLYAACLPPSQIRLVKHNTHSRQLLMDRLPPLGQCQPRQEHIGRHQRQCRHFGLWFRLDCKSPHTIRRHPALYRTGQFLCQNSKTGCAPILKRIGFAWSERNTLKI